MFERWFVGYSQGDSMLGVFGFFAAIAAALPVLADSGLGAVLYPRMMKAWQTNQLAEYRAYVRKLWITFAVFVVTATPLALIAVVAAVPHLHHAAYASHVRIYFVLLASAAIGSLAVVPQYILWAKTRDRSMVAIAITGLVSTVALDLVLVPRMGAMGAAWGQLAGICLVFGLRMAAIRDVERAT